MFSPLCSEAPVLMCSVLQLLRARVPGGMSNELKRGESAVPTQQALGWEGALTLGAASCIHVYTHTHIQYIPEYTYSTWRYTQRHDVHFLFLYRKSVNNDSHACAIFVKQLDRMGLLLLVCCL